MSALTSLVEVRSHLAELAQLRRRVRDEDEDIARDIRATLADARRLGMSMSEVARLLEIDRTGLYRTYINGPDGS
jgi:DNA invertase Pin-like site-specific DNA recombinase